MADRWNFVEDYIVCKYSHEHAWKDISAEQLDYLMSELKNAGFGSRSKTAVDKRVRAFQLLFIGHKSPYATKQVRLMYQNYFERINNPDSTRNIKSYIAEVYNPNLSTNEEASKSFSDMIDEINGHDNLIHLLYNIDYSQTLPMVLQKLIDKKGIRKHKEVCDTIGMKPDTFSAILRGKYRNVQKDNILKLCIGLGLHTEEAEELMTTAGFAFSNAILTDVIVKSFIRDRRYSPTAVNIELYENKAPLLFDI